MSITIGGIAVENYILPPNCDLTHRARSVIYALDGTAKEDRLGNYKNSLTISFGALPSNIWESLKTQLRQKQVSISGSIAGLSISGTYRVVENTIPTPVLVQMGNMYYCQPFSLNLEEI